MKKEEAEVHLRRQEAILGFLAVRLPGTPLTAETDLIADDLLDSLLILDLVAWMEAELGVDLRADDIAPRHFRSVERLSALVAAKLGA